ncbi:MAG: hypothetical protein E7375_00435 [Clostridiales bacterium]|nr:hypothetical protein [Clostridiales bacterium]
MNNKLIKILKKTIGVEALAVNFIKKQKKDMLKRYRKYKESEDLFITSEYKIGMPYDFSQKKINVESKRYASQVVEIARLRNNRRELYQIFESPKVSYYTQILTNRVRGLVETVLNVYESGKDTSEFDEEVKALNDYIESHIVYRAGHKTFRIVKGKEAKKAKRDYGQMKNERLKKIAEKDNALGELLKDNNG